MNNIYFISDLHLNHNKEFIYRKRGFDTIEDMNTAIISGINGLDDTDTLYILGDLVMGDIERAEQELRKITIPANQIKIIIGNHDTTARIRLYYELGYEVLGYSNVITYHKRPIYLSHYPTIVANFDDNRTINIFGHTHQFSKFYMDYANMYCVCPEANDMLPVDIDSILIDIQAYKQERKRVEKL